MASFGKLVEGWKLNIFASITSVLFVISLSIFLRYIDGMALSDWKTKVTPSTVVSILVQFPQGLSGFVNGTTVFQLGFLWFKRSTTRLCDFDTMFRASQGVHANIQIACTPRLWRKMIFPALLVILGQGMQAFAQNAITILEEQTSTGNSTIPQAKVYSYTAPSSFPGLPDAGTALKHAWENAWYGPGSGSSSYSLHLQPTCSSGNCTFPEFQTLGALGKCVDLTPNIASKCMNGTDTGQQCSYAVNNSLISLTDPQTPFNMSTNLDLGGQVDNLGVSQQFTFFDAMARLENFTVVASRCVTYLAILTLNSTIINGVTTEVQTREPIVNTTAHFTLQNPGGTEYFSIMPSPEFGSRPFYLTNDSTLGIQNYGRMVFTGLINDTGAVIPQLVFESMRSGTLEDYNSRMAAATGLQFRLYDALNSTIAGQSLRTVEHFKVRWQWISLPLFVPVATFILLLSTIALSGCKGEPRRHADIYTVIDNAPDNYSRWALFEETGSSSVRSTAGQTYYELKGPVKGPVTETRLRFVVGKASTSWIAQHQPGSKITENTEGAIPQTLQNAQNYM